MDAHILNNGWSHNSWRGKEPLQPLVTTFQTPPVVRELSPARGALHFIQFSLHSLKESFLWRGWRYFSYWSESTCNWHTSKFVITADITKYLTVSLQAAPNYNFVITGVISYIYIPVITGDINYIVIITRDTMYMRHYR